MKRVGVIGAGIFGLEVAKQLSQQDFDVTIFEKNQEILTQGTANSVSRLHLGLHYPRDLETAIQSMNGYRKFLEHYYDFVNLSFSNYYGIAKENSKVNENQFRAFAEKAGIPITEVDPKILSDVGFSHDRISAAWRCPEGAIDISALRRYFIEVFNGTVTINNSSEVVFVEMIGNRWVLKESDGRMEEFDYVVQATYGTDRIISGHQIPPRQKYEFHKTLTLDIKSGISNTGVTVVDGDFITVLPKGFTENLLIYGPSPSVLAKAEGFEFPINWEDQSEFDFEMATENLLDRFKEWFPGVNNVIVENRLITVRSIQPNMQATDKRVSLIQESAPNYFHIWSGKIDHCIEIAESLLDQLRAREL